MSPGHVLDLYNGKLDIEVLTKQSTGYRENSNDDEDPSPCGYTGFSVQIIEQCGLDPASCHTSYMSKATKYGSSGA